MRWIVGLDLRPDGQGAIATAGWLSRAATKQTRQRFLGVHVIPADRHTVRDDVLDEHIGRATDAAAQAIEGSRAAAAFERTDVIPGGEPEDVLAAAAQYHAADGLIIGRHGPKDGPALVRLGRVARRLVRRLPVPVMVVPPDFTPADGEPGPVVALTDLQSDSVPAVKLADSFAKNLGVKLVVVHVIRNPQAAFDPLESVKARHDKPAVENWLKNCGIEGADAMTASSDVVDSGLHVAQSRKASLLVCGSRRLSMAERTYLSSTGTELARFALRPVLIVPPERDPTS